MDEVVLVGGALDDGHLVEPDDEAVATLEVGDPGASRAEGPRRVVDGKGPCGGHHDAEGIGLEGGENEPRVAHLVEARLFLVGQAVDEGRDLHEVGHHIGVGGVANLVAVDRKGNNRLRFADRVWPVLLVPEAEEVLEGRLVL